MEFRAKLTELSYAKEILYEKMAQFLTARNETDRNAPHTIGNYFAIKTLSNELFNKELESDITKWKDIGTEEINKAAQRILEVNNSFLDKNNPKEIESFLGTESFLD